MSEEKYDLLLPEFFTCKRCGLSWPMKELKEVLLKDHLYPVDWCKKCFDDVMKGLPTITARLIPDSEPKDDDKIKKNK